MMLKGLPLDFVQCSGKFRGACLLLSCGQQGRSGQPPKELRGLSNPEYWIATVLDPLKM